MSTSLNKNVNDRSRETETSTPRSLRISHAKLREEGILYWDEVTTRLIRESQKYKSPPKVNPVIFSRGSSAGCDDTPRVILDLVNALRIIYIIVYFRFQITLTSLRHLSLFPNSQITRFSLSLSFSFPFIMIFCSVSSLSYIFFFPVTLHSYYITLYLCFNYISIKLHYTIYCTLYYIILYIYELSYSLTPFLCYSYSFEKRTIKSPIVTREEKRTDTALFSGRVTFFLREQKFWARTTFCIFRASPITLLRSFSCRSFRNLLHSSDFYKNGIHAKHETMMALLFWLARFYIFGFFATIKSPTTYSSFPEISLKKLQIPHLSIPSFSVPTIIFSRCTQPRIFQKLITNFWAQLLKDERKRKKNEFSYRFFTGPNRNSLFVRCRWFFSPPSPTFKTWISILTR